jgi:hypothetical protein
VWPLVTSTFSARRERLPYFWNCGDAVSCNAQELNSSGYAVSSSIFVQLAQGCGSVACFADVGSTAFNGAIYAVLMHEMLHNLAAPDVDSDADVMGFFVGTNDVGNSADEPTACDLAAIKAILSIAATGISCSS